MPRKKSDIHGALERLAAAERTFLAAEFLAPVIRGGRVAVRIAGVVCALRVSPRSFEGFGIFKAQSHASARLLREATRAERRKYLELFPQVRLVVSRREEQALAAVPVNLADARFSVEGEIELPLMDEEAELFDTIVARFDGSRFWFDQLDPRADAAAAPYLRQAITRMAPPKDLDRAGLMPGHRLAYLLNYRARLEAQLAEERARQLDARTRSERRLREALEHAGAQLRDFTEHRGDYRVTYEVDGRRHISVVRKNDLTVQTAGICLSGADRHFDLASLVGVLREGRAYF